MEKIIFILLVLVAPVAFSCGSCPDHGNDYTSSFYYDPISPSEKINDINLEEVFMATMPFRYRVATEKTTVLDKINSVMENSGRSLRLSTHNYNSFIKSRIKINACIDPATYGISSFFDHNKSTIMYEGSFTEKEKKIFNDAYDSKYHCFLSYTDFCNELGMCTHQNLIPPDNIPFEQKEELFLLTDHPRLGFASAFILSFLYRNEYEIEKSHELAIIALAKSNNEKEKLLARVIIDNLKTVPSKKPVNPLWIEKENPSNYYFHDTYPMVRFIQVAANDKNISDEKLSRFIRLQYSIREHDPENIDINPDDDYYLYLNAVRSFLSENYLEAAKNYSGMTGLQKGWIAESASYMVGRSLLLAAQKNWKFYSYIDGSNLLNPKNLPEDQDLLDKSAAAFNFFLETHPNSEFTESAFGLLRRVKLLQGDHDTYLLMLNEDISRTFKKLSEHSDIDNSSSYRLWSMANEYRRYAPARGDETLSHILNIYKSFQSESNPKLNSGMTHLASLSRAISLFQQKSNNLLNEKFDENAPLFRHHAILRARFFEQQGDLTSANEVWHRAEAAFNYKSDSQIAIASNLLKQGGIRAVLSSPYPLEPFLLEAYVHAQCGAPLNTALLEEDWPDEIKKIIIHDLSRRYLNNGEFSRLEALFNRYEDNLLGSLSEIRTAVRMVALGVNPEKGYMNIGYYLARREQPMKSDASFIDISIHTPECYECSAEPGSSFASTPYAYFQKAIESDKTSESETKAKSLHFLVMCSKPSGLNCWVNSYGKSKQWFDQLHKEYPNSVWANKTPYYYP